MIRHSQVVPALEHLYARSGEPLQPWSEGFLPHLRAMIPEATRASFSAVSFSTRRYDFASLEGDDGPRLYKKFLSLTQLIPESSIAALYRLPYPVTTFSEIGSSVVVAYMRRLFEQIISAPDLLGLVSEPEPGVGVVAALVVPAAYTLGARERLTLATIALHIEAATRLRYRPDAVVGYVTPSGCLELGPNGLRREKTEALQDAALGIERARSGSHRGEGEAALEVWSALVAGAYSLAERVDTDGKRIYDLYENAPRHTVLRALDERESFVVHECARGLSNKEVAYALGISQTGVSRALTDAARKLGVHDTRALVRLACGLRQAGTSVAGLDALTKAERVVVHLIVEGLTNEQIAIARGVSTRTVANQVAMVLRKTRVSSRRALTVLAR